MGGEMLTLLFITVASLTGAEVAVQVVPQGIESVNASDITMGCACPLVNRSGVMVCNNSESYLVDGRSPAINTSTSNWASQLVTVRKVSDNAHINFDHVLLTFSFNTAVSLTSIELDLFLCPEWGIGARGILVYALNSSSLVLTSTVGENFITRIELPNSSCNSLSNVSIPLERRVGYFHLWHILLDLKVYSFEEVMTIEWVHVGEVRFFGRGITNSNRTCNRLSTAAISTTAVISSSVHTYFQLTASHSMLSESMTLSSTMTTDPTQTSTDGPEIIRIVKIFAGPVGGLILLLIISIAVVSCCFKYHCSLKCNLNELEKYPDAVVEQFDVEDYSNDDYSSYESTEDGSYENINSGLENVPNPLYSSSVTEGEVTVMDTCSGGNMHATIPKENCSPALPLPKKRSAKLGKTKSKPPHDLPVYSDVQKNIPGVPPQSSDLLTSQDVVTPSTSPPVKMSNHDAMMLSCTDENPLYERSDSQAETQPTNIIHPTPSDRGYTVQPTAPPIEDIVYDNPVSPPVHASDDEKDSHIIDPIYDVPKMLPKDLQQPVEITSDNIREIRELGNGNFGKVMLAATRGVSLKDLKLSETDDNPDVSILVAVKKLIDNHSKEQKESFMKEVKLMSSLKHQNLVSLIGVCYDEPGFMMMEYMEEGDLSQFLQRYTEIVETPSNKTQISTSTLVYMASQIASAMKYLSSLNFIHRDIASRNCLVGNNFRVKLADFGMSRNLYESHYCRIQGKTSVPVRWMATECFYGRFSEKSDVWAFGVTMWELFILAKENPYSNLTNEEVINDATKGAHRQLLPRPSVCPVPVYNIMKRCWAIDPEERATFEEVEDMLHRYTAST